MTINDEDNGGHPIIFISAKQGGRLIAHEQVKRTPDQSIMKSQLRVALKIKMHLIEEAFSRALSLKPEPVSFLIKVEGEGGKYWEDGISVWIPEEPLHIDEFINHLIEHI